MEDYFFEIREEIEDDRVFVLIIYDIISNKKRLKLAKYLQGYGFRIQKSAFEAMLRKDIYRNMLKGLKAFASEEDSIRVYKIIGKGQITNFGKDVSKANEEIIII